MVQLVPLLIGNGLMAYQNPHKEIVSTLDSNEIRHAQLANGLKYYVKDLNNNTNKFDIYFYVKVGNFDQEFDQLEFAHTLEHLAFRCAKDFPFSFISPPKEFLRSIGMEDNYIEGQTGNDLTYYHLKDLPSGNVDAMDKNLLWLSNMSDLKLTNEAIDNERLVIKQEIIYRSSNNVRFDDETKLKSLLYPGFPDRSNFFERNDSYSPDSLIQFYRSWYNPKNMGIAIIGDIPDINAIELKIEKYFSKIKNHRPLAERKNYQRKYLEGPNNYAIIEKQEGNGNIDGVELFLFFRYPEILSQYGYFQEIRREILRKIIIQLIYNRFRNGQDDHDYFFSKRAGFLTKSMPFYEIQIPTRERNLQRSIDKTFEILQQIKQFGISKDEWDWIKSEYNKASEQINIGKIDFWHKNFLNNFLYEIEITPEFKYHLPPLSRSEFNTLCNKFIQDMPDDIGVLIPPGSDASLYTEQHIRKYIKHALSEPIKPVGLPKIPENLLNKKETSNLKEVGYTHKGSILDMEEFVLDNGIRIVLDTSIIDSSKVFFHGFSSRGASCFPQEYFLEAINAPSIVDNAGVGNLSRGDLKYYFNQTNIDKGFSQYIKNSETGIRGEMSADSFDIMAQLIYLSFTKPREDKNAFDNWLFKENRKGANINADFRALIDSFLRGKFQNNKGKGIQEIDQIDMKRAYEIYRNLYGNPSDFTFLFNIGNLPVDTVLPFISKYLGNIPQSPQHTCPTENRKKKANRRNTPFYKEFYPKDIGAEYKLESVKYFQKYFVPIKDRSDWAERIKIEALGYWLNNELLQLRTNQQAVIYQYIGDAIFNKKLSGYDIYLYIDCIPEELEILRESSRAIIDKMSVRNPDVEENNKWLLELIKRKLSSKYKRMENSKNFHALSKKVQAYYMNDQEIQALQNVEEFIQALTYKDIMETAEEYLKAENMMEFVYRDPIK